MPRNRLKRAHERRGRANSKLSRGLCSCAGLLSLLGAFSALATLAGCGSTPFTGTTADPASVVPARAQVYIGALLAPTGALARNVQAAQRTLAGHTDPHAWLAALLRTPGRGALDYGHDIEPWLGRSGGIFFSSLGHTSLADLLALTPLAGSPGSDAPSAWPFAASGGSGAIVLDSDNSEAARAFIATAADAAAATPSSYRGVRYSVDPSGDAFALIDRLVVLGSQSALHEVIDTIRGGSALPSDPTYATLSSLAPAGSLAHLFVEPRALSSIAAPALTDALAGTRKAAPALNISLLARAGSLALDADTTPAVSQNQHAQSAGTLPPAAAGTRAFDELPGQSWFAAGLGRPGAGKGLRLGGRGGLLGLGAVAGASSASGNLAAMIPALERLLGTLGTPSWMGEVGIFASGNTIADLRAGIVIDSDDRSASRSAVAALGAALSRAGDAVSQAHIQGTEAAIEAEVHGLPITLVIADGRDRSGRAKFVIGASEYSIQDALDPSATMADSASAHAAASALGEAIKPNLALSFAPLISWLTALHFAEEPSLAPLLAYLRAASTLSVASKRLGGQTLRTRLVLGLQSARSR